MGILDRFIEPDYATGTPIQYENYVFRTAKYRMVDPAEYKYLGTSRTASPYLYLKYQDAVLKQYPSEQEALDDLVHLPDNLDDYNLSDNHEHLYIRMFDPERTIGYDRYIFRCVGCDRAVVLTAQTSEQDKADNYWETAKDNFREGSPLLIYSLLDLFLKLDSLSLLQLVKEPLFKEMVKRTKPTGDTLKPEHDFLTAKIKAIYPAFTLE